MANHSSDRSSVCTGWHPLALEPMSGSCTSRDDGARVFSTPIQVVLLFNAPAPVVGQSGLIKVPCVGQRCRKSYQYDKRAGRDPKWTEHDASGMAKPRHRQDSWTRCCIWNTGRSCRMRCGASLILQLHNANANAECECGCGYYCPCR